jgi:hypothetical protein
MITYINEHLHVHIAITDRLSVPLVVFIREISQEVNLQTQRSLDSWPPSADILPPSYTAGTQSATRDNFVMA